MKKSKKKFSNFRLVFAGGIDWSIDFLKLLLKEGFLVVGVLSPEDSKKNRGQRESAHALKIAAQKLNIPVLTPHKLTDPEFLQEFEKWKANVVVVVAYGKIFPQKMLDIPPKGFINFHPSVLPALRGPSPISSAILEGMKETGITIMKLGKGMDDGPIFTQKKIKISKSETAVSLTQKLLESGKEVLISTLKDYLEKDKEPTPQPKKKVSYCKIISKDEGKINWKKDSAQTVDRKIRAFQDQIKVYSSLEKGKKNKRVNFLESGGVLKLSGEKKMKTGNYELLKKGSEKILLVKTKDDFLLLKKLQVEGKSPVTGEEFYLGYEGGKFI